MDKSQPTIYKYMVRNGKSVPTASRSPVRRQEHLVDTAIETIATVKRLTRELNTTAYAQNAVKHSLENLPRLDPIKCPSYRRKAVIKVINEDTLNAAIRLASISSDGDDPARRPLPVILNFANPYKPGGGWRNGAIAQEEAICYRSSLAMSLKHEHYPLGMGEALYSEYVLVMREDMESGHKLLTTSTPADELPVVSALTVAALERPGIRKLVARAENDEEDGDDDSEPQLREKCVFARDRDRDITKSKMRLALRMAAYYHHDLLVLGALGCGVFANPTEDVAHCWLEVLREDEFSGNWWREVCFAVYDKGKGEIFDTFDRVLSGKKV